MSGLMLAINILCGKFGVTDKAILSKNPQELTKIPGTTPGFLRAINGIQLEILKESIVIWVPGGIKRKLANACLRATRWYWLAQNRMDE